MDIVRNRVRHVYDELAEAVSYRNNRIYIVIVIAFLVGYQSLQFFLEHPDWYVTFDPGLTIWLQETFSFQLLDHALSYYYPTGFIICLVLLNYLMVKEGKWGWKWGYAVLCCWVAHFAIAMVYPVAPPLRWESGAQPIRLEVFPISDALVSVKYGGLPSGHFGYVFIGYLIARYKYIKTGLSSYNKYKLFFLANLIVTTFTVLYLGEHTWEDLAASFFIFGGIFWAFSKWMEKTTDVHMPERAPQPVPQVNYAESYSEEP